MLWGMSGEMVLILAEPHIKIDLDPFFIYREGVFLQKAGLAFNVEKLFDVSRGSTSGDLNVFS